MQPHSIFGQCSALSLSFFLVSYIFYSTEKCSFCLLQWILIVFALLLLLLLFHLQPINDLIAYFLRNWMGMRRSSNLSLLACVWLIFMISSETEIDVPHPSTCIGMTSCAARKQSLLRIIPIAATNHSAAPFVAVSFRVSFPFLCALSLKFIDLFARVQTLHIHLVECVFAVQLKTINRWRRRTRQQTHRTMVNVIW